MKSWNVNTVRLPLNEGCWLNYKVKDAQYGGVNYINFIKAYVKTITDLDMAVILDLHWTAGLITLLYT